LTCFKQIELKLVKNPQWNTPRQDKIKEAKEMFKEFKDSTKKINKKEMKPK